MRKVELLSPVGNIEMLYQGYEYTGAFAVSAILVLMAVIILILKSVLEYKGKKEA